MKKILLLSFLFSLSLVTTNAQVLNCTEASLIDLAYPCPAPAPTDSVCGCDGNGYISWCEALYHNGITYWTNGACVALPVCQAMFDYSIIGSDFTFQDQTANATGWSWDFGDGSPIDNTQSPTHTYATAGMYVVCLTSDESGICQSTSCRAILAQGGGGGCLPAFTWSVNCGVLTLTDVSTGTYDNVSWDFGDGSSLQNQTPGSSTTHEYTASGSYNVIIDITGVGGCNSAWPDSVTVVNPTVTAAFTYSGTGAGPYTITFNNTSVDGVTYFWDLGNGDTSTAANPVADYDTCSYTVYLMTTDANGCTADYTEVINPCGVGISSIQSSVNQVSVYPNPAKDYLNVVMNGNRTGNVTLRMQDVTGRDVIESKSLHITSGENNYKLNLPSLPTGIYLIQVSDDYGTSNSRVLIR